MAIHPKEMIEQFKFRSLGSVDQQEAKLQNPIFPLKDLVSFKDQLYIAKFQYLIGLIILSNSVNSQ